MIKVLNAGFMGTSGLLTKHMYTPTSDVPHNNRVLKAAQPDVLVDLQVLTQLLVTCYTFHRLAFLCLQVQGHSRKNGNGAY
jgi:hypothetical protein